MKKWGQSYETLKTFKYPEDIAEVEAFVAKHYNPNSFTCLETCIALEHMYSNLKAVQIACMWIDGHMETNHCVCLVEGDAGEGCNMIDPTGDQFLSDQPTKMRCAAFRKTELGYLSNNYMPAREAS